MFNVKKKGLFSTEFYIGRTKERCCTKALSVGEGAGGRITSQPLPPSTKGRYIHQCEGKKIKLIACVEFPFGIGKTYSLWGYCLPPSDITLGTPLMLQIYPSHVVQFINKSKVPVALSKLN